MQNLARGNSVDIEYTEEKASCFFVITYPLVFA